MSKRRYSKREQELYCVGKTKGIDLMAGFFGWELIHAEPERNYWVLKNDWNGEIKIITADPRDLDPEKAVQSRKLLS